MAKYFEKEKPENLYNDKEIRRLRKELEKKREEKRRRQRWNASQEEQEDY